MAHCLTPRPLRACSVNMDWESNCVELKLLRYRPKRSSLAFGLLLFRAGMTGHERDRRYGSSNMDFGEDRLEEGTSMWDSNAEQIRRHTSRRSRSFRGPTTTRRPSTHSDYDSSEENATDIWQWWQIFRDDDAYGSNRNDSDEEDGLPMFFSLFNFDVKRVFSVLSWMSPALIMLLPWLLGNPIILMMAFILFPAAQKTLGFFLPCIWKSFMKNLSPSPPKSKQKRHSTALHSKKKAGTKFMRPDIAETKFSKDNSWAENDKTSARFPSTPAGIDAYLEGKGSFQPDNGISQVPLSHKQNMQSRNLSMGGWEDLDGVRQNAGAYIQDRKKEGLRKPLRGKEIPLFFRFLIALFPFLRSWGGFL